MGGPLHVGNHRPVIRNKTMPGVDYTEFILTDQCRNGLPGMKQLDKQGNKHLITLREYTARETLHWKEFLTPVYYPLPAQHSAPRSAHTTPVKQAPWTAFRNRTPPPPGIGSRSMRAAARSWKPS